MLGLLKKIFGTKQERDIGKYEANVVEINRHFEQYQNLSNDELRNKTLEFRERIREYLATIDAEIVVVNQQAIDAEDFNDKEDLFKEVDELRKQRACCPRVVLLPEFRPVVQSCSSRSKPG